MNKPQDKSWHGPQGPHSRRVLRITCIQEHMSIEVAQFKPQPPPKPPKAQKPPKAANRLLIKRPDMRTKSGLTPASDTKDVTDIKKTLPVINACKYPSIQGANDLPAPTGKGAKSQEQADRKNGICYEDFLQDHVITARREGLLNRYFNSFSSLSPRGLTVANIATLAAMDRKQESLKPVEYQRATNPLRSPWMTEYGDRFGYLERMYPPRTPHPPPRIPSHHQRVPATLLRKGPVGHGPWSEYQANFHKQV